MLADHAPGWGARSTDPLLVFGIAFMVVFLDLLSREDRATAVAERAAAGERSARWEEVAS